MNQQKKKYLSAFTLIELMVVISIIGVLASTLLASLNTARAKSRDARKQADFRQITLAFQLFFDSNRRMPANFGPPGTPKCEGQAAPNNFYEQSMGELVTARFLRAVPLSPGGGLYCYFDAGAGNSTGALLITQLETVANSTTGIPPSCRPIASPGMCDNTSTKYYCLCNRY